jgi:hypothetical protein
MGKKKQSFGNTNRANINLFRKIYSYCKKKNLLFIYKIKNI